MNVTINQLLVAVVILLLVGCSSKGGQQIDQQEARQQTRAKKPSALEMCKPVAGSPHFYHKTVLVAATTAVNDVARDLPGIAILTSQRLQTHLDELERFKVVSAHRTGFASNDSHTAELVRQIGQQYSPQFVVKLEILDLTLHTPKGMLGELFEKKRRDVQLKLLIYDAENGTLFYSQQYEGTVNGDVAGYPGNGSRVSISWFSTDLGIKVDEMIKTISKQVNEQLACVPFASEVAAVRDDKIHINAGYLHGIKPGDTLRVYHRSELRTNDGEQNLEKRGGWVRITQVFPDRSIAVSTEDKPQGSLVDTGDIVRAW